MKHQKPMQRREPLPLCELEIIDSPTTETKNYLTREERFTKKFGTKGKIKIREKV